MEKRNLRTPDAAGLERRKPDAGPVLNHGLPGTGYLRRKGVGCSAGDGNYHCFNAVGDCVFDLTSEQFGDEKLDYSLLHEQKREIHFGKQEKKERYEALKAGLLQYTTHHSHSWDTVYLFSEN